MRPAICRRNVNDEILLLYRFSRWHSNVVHRGCYCCEPVVLAGLSAAAAAAAAVSSNACGQWFDNVMHMKDSTRCRPVDAICLQRYTVTDKNASLRF